MLGSLFNHSTRYPEKETLQIEELSIQIIRSQRKSLALQVKPKGLILRAPLNCSKSELTRFVLSKVNWLRKRATNMQEQLKDSEKSYQTGESFLFKGENFSLDIIKGSKGTAAFNTHTAIISIIVPNNIKDKPAYAQRKLNAAYKAEALAHLSQRCAELSKKTGLQFKSIKVRDYKARWGSCSSSGDLAFNWRIIMAPLAAIDSVIIHELAHTKHFNHSKAFWALVNKHCPNYQESHLFFQENQYRLMY